MSLSIIMTTGHHILPVAGNVVAANRLPYTGGYTILTDLLRQIRPDKAPSFEVRFETPPGR